jgi:hypothetical protein
VHHCCSPSLRGHIRMASCALGELIPCAFVWHDPGITPCCKSLKTPGDKFPARRRNKPRSLINVVSGSLPKSPVSLSPGDEVPHMFTRKPLLQPEKFAVDGAKRLLQHNRHIPAVATAAKDGRSRLESGRWRSAARWLPERELSGYVRCIRGLPAGAGNDVVLAIRRTTRI